MVPRAHQSRSRQPGTTHALRDSVLFRSPTPNPQEYPPEYPPSSVANKAIPCVCVCVCARARPSLPDARVASPQLRCGPSVRASPNARSGHIKGGPSRRPRRHGGPPCLTTPLACNGATPPWRHALPHGPAIPDGSTRRRAALGQASAARENQRTRRRPPPPPHSPKPSRFKIHRVYAAVGPSRAASPASRGGGVARRRFAMSGARTP